MVVRHLLIYLKNSATAIKRDSLNRLKRVFQHLYLKNSVPSKRLILRGVPAYGGNLKFLCKKNAESFYLIFTSRIQKDSVLWKREVDFRRKTLGVLTFDKILWQISSQCLITPNVRTNPTFWAIFATAFAFPNQTLQMLKFLFF